MRTTIPTIAASTKLPEEGVSSRTEKLLKSKTPVSFSQRTKTPPASQLTLPPLRYEG